LHGLFDQPEACRALLSWAGAVEPQAVNLEAVFEENIERLAGEMKKCIDLNLLMALLDREMVGRL
jgi:adenosylcobyric acid synthase